MQLTGWDSRQIGIGDKLINMKKIIKWLKEIWNKIKEWFHNKEENDAQPDPTPVNLEDFTPPARTGKDKWTNNGKFNSYKSLGRAKESSCHKVTIQGWFKANSWSGGGKEQPAGFCFACKGLIGSHWGVNLLIRPNALVWNATKGEVSASCKVNLNEWYHVKTETTCSKAKFWLNGHLLVTGEKPFAASLIQDSEEELRLGGYYCPWPNVTWFNQSLNGEISDYSIELT